MCTNQLSSLSIEDPEDADLEYTMRNLPPSAGHIFASQEVHMMCRDTDSRTCPHTPGTPTFMCQAGRTMQGREPDLLHRCRFSFTSCLESPLSPSRSKSPWSRIDPYDSPEVTFKIFMNEFESCLVH